jgi:uncharacterized membrane protein YqjE
VLDEGAPPLPAMRSLARRLIGFIETRAQLAANEFEEQAVRFFEVAVWLLAALFLVGVALVMSALAVVLAFWETHRVLAAVLVAALFFGGGALCALAARKLLAQRPRFLAATLGELARDRERVEAP